MIHAPDPSVLAPPAPALLAVATALPPHRLEQAAVLAAVRAVYAPLMRDFERLAPVFANSAIACRYAAMPLDWYMRPHDWPERAAAFHDAALPLLETAAARALQTAGLRPSDVDVIVCATTTGIATPSLEALLLERMGFRPDTIRLPIFGLGCAGGALGLARAGAMARAMPGRVVLFLVVELCSLSCRPDQPTPTNVVATALFADGAAAAVLRCDNNDSDNDRGRPRLLGSGEHTWPGTRGVMGWRMDASGFGVIFSQDIPRLIRDRLPAAVDAFLARNGLGRAELAGLICHPGGVKVLQALAEVFAPLSAGLDDATAVLQDYGNMSAVSVMFVLERRMAAGARGLHLMTALGPGFTAAFTLVAL